MTSYEFNSRFLGKKHDTREKFPAITIMNISILQIKLNNSGLSILNVRITLKKYPLLVQ